MDRTEIAIQLKTFLETEFPSQSVELTEATELLHDWFFDSLGIIETVLFVESTFCIEVQRADITGANFRNIGTLVDFVVERLGN
jgi:acyl carrier protein